ncbi:MAG: carboxypeptidase M32 [Oscillospiraceae bacterium]|nr:carboxypeptidase M32 [Oscillospiraceae bacterium]
MTTNEALKIYRENIAKMNALGHAMGVMHYDAATVAPAESAEGRGKTLAYLSGCTYEIQTGAALQEAAQYLNQHKDELNAQDRREIEVFLRQNEFTAAIPKEEFVGYVKLLNEADAVWHKAKLDSDFTAFSPYIKDIFAANIRFAKYYKPDRNPYDTQLDRYERGLTMEKTDAFFNALKERIVPLLKKVMAKPQVDDSFLWGKTYPKEAQKQFSEYLMDVITIDKKRCSIGETEHPFTTMFNKKDVRVTTHYYPETPVYSMYSVIHEGGHALYELHSGDQLEGTILRGGVSMSMHESQSRFMENYIGRSREFLSLIFPKMQELFPEQLAGVTAEQMYLAVNKAEPSLIRTEADELTYALHVLVRYEIEKGLFDGSIAVEDLPRIWNAKYKEYLGIDVPDDKRGVLQDSHWSNGNVGYFPSYALGSAYGAQMLAKMRQTVDVEAAIRSGDLRPITGWLEEHIWKFGSLYDPMELLERALGEPFDPKYFTDYLEQKFTEIYDL